MNNSKKANIRQDKIRDMLLEKDMIRLQEFCTTLNASEATIRNDLTFLEKQHVLKRVLGGAMSTEGTPRNTNYHLRSSLYIEEKKEIAEYVVMTFVKDGMTITLDAGTTCRFIAQALLNHKVSCSVITNSFASASVLEKSNDIQLILIGGKYDKEHASFYDPSTTETIATMYSDIYFLSPNGIDLKGQITSSASAEHAVKKAFMKQAKKVIVVADHSKFQKTALKVLNPLDQVDQIITDHNLNLKVYEDYKKANANLFLANT